MEQLTKDEARILLELVDRPRNYQGTIEQIRTIADTFDGIRKKLVAMGGAEKPQAAAAPAADQKPKRKRH